MKDKDSSLGYGPWDWSEDELASPENEKILDRLGDEFQANEKIIENKKLLEEYRHRKRQESLKVLRDVRAKQEQEYPKGDYPEIRYIGDNIDWSIIS